MNDTHQGDAEEREARAAPPGVGERVVRAAAGFVFYVFVPAVFGVSFALTHGEIPVALAPAKLAMSAMMVLLYLPLIAHNLDPRDGGIGVFLAPVSKAFLVFASTFVALNAIW